MFYFKKLNGQFLLVMMAQQWMGPQTLKRPHSAISFIVIEPRVRNQDHWYTKETRPDLIWNPVEHLLRLDVNVNLYSTLIRRPLTVTYSPRKGYERHYTYASRNK